MKKALFFPLQVSLCTVGCLYASSGITHAQVTSDGTVNTQVNQDGNSAVITGGETRGGNLFHSFQDFSVPTGNEAFFNNTDSISNIFSRVTGGNISNIDGAIRANGSASLFLINPAGIIFGENARLDIGGSFYGSTASSILFEDGEFSAADLENQPLLTVNAPVGLGFRDSPGDIVNRSLVQNSEEEVIGLEVATGQNLSFIGGNINFNSGNATAREGNIVLGGLSEAGIVSISNNANFIFPENIIRGDITLSNNSVIDVRGTGGGNIDINARNLMLEAGELGVSGIRGGINADSNLVDAQAGNITIDVVENIEIDGGRITNNIDPDAVGNSGEITIDTFSLSITNGGRIDVSTFGEGDAGSVNITAIGDIAIDGENSSGLRSTVISGISPQGKGDAGEINISTTNLSLTNGGIIDVSTFGQGSAGSVNVTTTGDVTIDGANSTGDFVSGFIGGVGFEGEGDAGEINISTTNFSLTNGGSTIVSTGGEGDAGAVNVIATGDITIDGENSTGDFVSSFVSRIFPGGEGDAGEINISTTNLSLTNGGEVNVSTGGQGDAGLLNIIATGNITIDGEESPSGFTSNVSSQVDPDAVGSSGGVTISTTNLNLTNGGQVDASTFGQGNAGSVNITATGDIAIDGKNSGGFSSGITSQVTPGAVGNSGGVTISTTNLNLTNGGRVNSNTFGQGDAGLLNIIATGNITIDGGESPSGFTSNISSQVNPDAVGSSEGVTISTINLNLTNGGRVDATTFGQGNAGLLNIIATGDIAIDGENSGGFSSGITSQVTPGAVGSSEGVTISTINLNLTDGGQVDASTFGQGNAGLLNIIATGDIAIDGENSGGFPSGITSQVNPDAVGSSEGVTISTTNLNLTNGGQVSSSTFGQGNADSVNITATGDIAIDGENSGGFPSGITSQVNPDAVGNSGGVTISTTNLNLTNGGQVSSSTFGQGNAGSVNITATESIFIDGSMEESFRSGIFANAIIEDGAGGDLVINTDRLTIANGGTIEAANVDTLGVFESGTGRPGNLSITANSINLTDNARIEVATQFTEGESAIVNLNIAEDIILRSNSFISARAFQEANGGNLDIDARFIIAFPDGNNDILASAEQGQGGNITINAESLFGIQERTPSNSTNDINASSQVSGLDGTISISTPDINPVQGATELPSNVVEPGETTEQACQANREALAKGGLNIVGKGGIVPDPALPLNSLNVIANGENTTTSTIPAPIETAQGKIQPARGVKITESGEVILTAYRTNNSGERIPEKRNCG